MRRIIFSITIFLFSLSSVMGQMIPINLPADGNWPTIVGDSIMIIGPRQNELTEEQRYFNPIYLMTYPGKEHLKAQMIRAGACDCDPTKPNRRIGVFSVAPDKQVSFSQGNLQYLPAINLWKFADTQYAYLGNANKYLKPTFRNWVDLFGWSANNTTAPFGVSTSTNAADYAGDFVDWGTNTICGDAPGTWRTLSIEEWEYIYHGRKNADQLLAIATLEGVPGLILLPDNWQQPEDIPFVSSVEQGLAWDATIVEGSYFDATNKDHTKDNIYTQAQWQKMEALGAVFLPCAGWRQEKTWTHAGIVEVNIKYLGSYWSCSTPQISNDYYFFRFTQQEIRKFPLNNSLSLLARGRSVRLVHDTIVPKPPKRIGVFSVAADKKVSFSQGNLQYVQSTDTWQFANNQLEYMGEKHLRNGQLADTIEYFGWSGKDSKAPWGISLSTNDDEYRGEFLDWGTNSIAGGVPNTWRTLSNDEWLYICQGRKNAVQLLGLGQINNCTGLIILPDDWQLPAGLSFTPNTDDATKNQYTYAQWAEMENVGAVFIPNNGYMNVKLGGMRKLGTDGYVRTSTLADDGRQIYTVFHPNKITYTYSGNNEGNLFYAFSQRLVHDTIVQETIPEPCLVVKVNDTLSINMMCVEGGTFTMGDGENAHPVSLSNYSIGQTEVTQALWEAVMGTTPSANTANKQLPVTNISWYDCQEFIKKLNQQTGMRFRLPTEAEWEYAARGGQKSKGYTYAGSNDLKEVAWYNGNSGNTLHTVGQKKPNELGIYDMSGNVWEWCHDWHAPYPTTHQYNPLGPEVGQIVGKRYLRVFRGGSYGYEAAYHQNAFRDITGPEPNIGTANLGLRLVLSDDVNFETVHVNDTLSFHMMNVNGDTFTMGDDNISNASPAHQVTLSDYYIGETEVTQTLWKAVMGNVPTGNKNPSYPVGYVSYADCLDFIVKLNKLTSLHFQLPTEAEWEYAAMGGNKSHNYIYSGSNTIDDVAWYDQNSENKLHHVGTKQPNELGIYDMSGNAWEWCADYHGKYTAENQINPQEPAAGTGRVIRSGSFRTTADRCTNKHRQAREADYPDSHITLRLVLHDTVPVLPEPEYVDLGLSVKWATFNVGASKPEDYGDYFAWGETETKDKYSWATYKWCDGTSTNMTKYNTEDGKTILEPADDAAQVHWGGKWRMPSKEEVDELTQQCNWIWTTHNNVNGYKVTGPNGNSIFLPAAGYKGTGPTYPAGEDGLYWTNTIEKRHYSYLIVLHEDAPPTQAGSSGTRCFGFAIRPVYDDRVE